MAQKLKLSFRSIVSLAVLAGLIYVSLNYQNLLDEWRLRGYNPPPEIVKLADNTTMSDSTRRLFRVTDKRLDGVNEVTAAHEVLHAAYERLSAEEKRNVDSMTAAMLAKITDKRILDTVEQYRTSDLHSVPNELHSILATEVPRLSPELEQYYSQYFGDRQRIISYSEDYQDAFESREDEAKAILGRMTSLQEEIGRLDAELGLLREELNAQYQQLEASRDSADPAEFNAQARAYNAKVQEFNSTLAYRNSLAEQYNRLRSEYNSLVVEEKELIKAIDSRAQSL
jgi:chromosome segregation ATPase